MKYLAVWKLAIHWQVVLAMIVGVAIGIWIQTHDAEPAIVGVEFSSDEDDGAVIVSSVDTGNMKGELAVGDRVLLANDVAISTIDELEALVREQSAGITVTLEVLSDGARKIAYTKTAMTSGSVRAGWIAPFDFIAHLFLRMLQMLIVPLIVTSMVSGMVSIGDPKSLGRMGLKTFLFYVTTSLLAILVGFVLVNMIGPGEGAELNLSADVSGEDFDRDENPFGILLRMVPSNVFGGMSSNGKILQVIFFSILFGVFISRVGGESGAFLSKLFQSAFDVMMRMAEFVLSLVPIGVVALIARVVGMSGLDPFKDLAILMLTVILGLAFHACITLPLILLLIGRVNPLRWAKAVSPALLMAFSTSSSSATLPVTMRSVKERGRASNRVSSFVLPLGATINMDGTALYECVGVLFLAQFYASNNPDFDLTFAMQVVVVVTALLASVGAAGIPGAGLVMMTTILSALGLPLEGTVFLLAIDRPLDMLRTATNVWSDTTCVAVIARGEGEEGIAGGTGAGPPEPGDSSWTESDD